MPSFPFVEYTSLVNGFPLLGQMPLDHRRIALQLFPDWCQRLAFEAWKHPPLLACCSHLARFEVCRQIDSSYMARGVSF